jgi:hypothetical protein
MGTFVPLIGVMQSAIGTKRWLQTQSCQLLKCGFLPLHRLGSQQRLPMTLTLFKTTFDKLRDVLNCVFFAKKTTKTPLHITHPQKLLENHVKHHFLAKLCI